MKQLMSSAEARALDEATRRLFCLDSRVLIEKASLRLWDALKAGNCLRKGRSTRIVALCGNGGNGDDALAMLRHAFSAGHENLAAIVTSRRSEGGFQDGETGQENSLESAGIELRAWGGLGEERALDTLRNADLVLDAVLGTGASGVPRGEAAEMIGILMRLSKEAERPLIVSIDIPSGIREGWLEGEPCVAADICLALEPLKRAHFLPVARSLCGRIIPVSDIFPQILLQADAGAVLLEESDLGALQPFLDPAVYKKRRGRLAIFAGSRGMAGAARLCARAAAASGAGYLTLYVDEELLPTMAMDLESCIVKPLEAWSGDLSSCDAALAGPGWGRAKGRKELLESIAGSGIPLILDADALRIAAEEPCLLPQARGPVALTPHPGEFAALASAVGRPDSGFSLELLEDVGRKCRAVIVYKSHVTWIRGLDGRMAVWDGMDPGLGTAGSGDVLSGLTAGLAASALAEQRSDSPSEVASALRDAACAAVIAHGIAGRALGREKGWFEAADLAPACAKILRDSRVGHQATLDQPTPRL